MKIKEITWGHRYDFHANMECEHCGRVVQLKTGYDDQHYHANVIPAMRCAGCGKNRAGDTDAVAPKGVGIETH